MENKNRCAWCLKDETYIKYHDQEWGRALHDDLKLFEMLCLEGAQAGLSWLTILKKRENYRLAFDDFNPEKISKYDETKINELINNAGIIRNKLKINAFICNARAFLKIKEEYPSFDNYIWSFVNHSPIRNRYENFSQIPVTNEISDAMSKDLKKRGFKFVGSTICYSFMQAVGMMNDHLISCFCHNEIDCKTRTGFAGMD